jgi:hypothetical protein
MLARNKAEPRLIQGGGTRRAGNSVGHSKTKNCAPRHSLRHEPGLQGDMRAGMTASRLNATSHGHVIPAQTDH